MANDALKIVTQEDSGKAKWPAARMPGATGDLDSASLLTMLSDIERLKREVEERMQQMESGKPSKAAAAENYLRSEAPNQRTIDSGKGMTVVSSGFRAADSATEAEGLRRANREFALDTEPDEMTAVGGIEPEVLRDSSQTSRVTSVSANRAEKLIEEARRLLDQSSARLDLAAQREEQALARLLAGQEAIDKVAQTAIDRLTEAERCWKSAQVAALEARENAKASAEDLVSSRQELTTAYQFASVAAQRRMASALFYQKTSRWVVFSTAFAWMLSIWMLWFAFNRSLSVFIPLLGSCAILGGAVYLRKRTARELEEN